MRLLFLCLVTGEIGLALFCYYRQITYSGTAYVWTGLVFAVLPLLLTYIEPEESGPFQELVIKELNKAAMSYQELRFSGDYVAFASCLETQNITIITPTAQAKAALSCQSIPINDISKISFSETLDGWKIQINDEFTYILKQTRLITNAMACWEEFFKQAGVPVTVTYEDTTDYWLSRSLGITISIPAVLLILLSF